MFLPNVQDRWWRRGRQVGRWGRWFPVFHFHLDVFSFLIISYERWIGQRIEGLENVPLVTIRVVKMLSVTIAYPFKAPSSLIYPFSCLLHFSILIINPFKYTDPAIVFRRTDLTPCIIFVDFSTLPLHQRLRSNLGLTLDHSLLKEFISCFSNVLTIGHFLFRQIHSRGGHLQRA